MVESEHNDFFPKIAQVAEKTNALEDRDLSGKTDEEDDGDRPVEEIESLCMSCGEQVRGSNRPHKGLALNYLNDWCRVSRSYF